MEAFSMKKNIELHTQKKAARVFVHHRLLVLNELYGFTYNKVAIRNQRTRWGSCSKKGNLNFNYRVASLPFHLADYIIVHESPIRGQVLSLHCIPLSGVFW